MLKIIILFIAAYLLISWAISMAYIFIIGLLCTDDALVVMRDANSEKFWRCVRKAWSKIAEDSRTLYGTGSRCTKILLIIFMPQLLASWVSNRWYDMMILVLNYYFEGLS